MLAIREHRFPFLTKVCCAAGRLGDAPLMPKGSKEGEFNCPEGLAVALDGSVVVADSLNHRVQMFAPDGRFLRAFGGHGANPVDFPYGKLRPAVRYYPLGPVRG